MEKSSTSNFPKCLKPSESVVIDEELITEPGQYRIEANVPYNFDAVQFKLLPEERSQ